jgi:hypothetical protein
MIFCTIYDLRFTIYDLRFTIYDLRFTIYDLRFTIYDLNVKIVVQRTLYVPAEATESFSHYYIGVSLLMFFSFLSTFRHSLLEVAPPESESSAKS